MTYPSNASSEFLCQLLRPWYVLIYCFLISLLDSIHGGSGHEGMVPLDQQYQLFASAGAIKFPAPESEAWKEKVYRVKLLNL